MPLPKKRHSKTRGRKRRTHWTLKTASLAPCPACKSLKLPHRICSVCGTYSGKQAIEIKTKKEKEKTE